MGKENWKLTREMDENGKIQFQCKHFFNKGRDRAEHSECEVNRRDCIVMPSLGYFKCTGYIEVYWTELIVRNSSTRPNLSKEVKEAYEIP